MGYIHFTDNRRRTLPMAKKKNKKDEIQVQRTPVHLASKAELESEIAELTLKRQKVLLKESEHRRLKAIQIELGHRKYRLPRYEKAITVQGGTAGATKK